MIPYLSHLAEVNEIQPVLSAEDILSEQGAMLLKQGERINEQTAAHLSKHKFSKPIEHSITLEKCFNSNVIYSLFVDIITEDPVFEELYQLSNLEEQFKTCITAFCQHDALQQKLNVLAIQLPEAFEQAFICGWMIVATLAHEAQPQDQLNNAFIAALSQDFGLLDVSPDILFKPSPLTPEDNNRLQQHPINSAKLLKRLEGIHQVSVRAVLEHHETIDGSGYPSGKVVQQLSDIGQLLNLVAGANAIYQKHFKSRQRTLHDMVPIIQMSNLSRKEAHLDPLIALFNRTHATEHCTITDNLIPAAIDLVKKNAHFITQFVLHTGEFSANIGTKHGELSLLSLQNITRMIRAALNSCGLINDAYMRWLDQVNSEKLDYAYRELEDALLMTEEIKFHIQRYRRQIDHYLDQDEPGALINNVTELKLKLDMTPQAEQTELELVAYLRGETNN